MNDPSPILTPLDAAPARRPTLRYWIIAWIIAGTYLLAYASMIHRHTGEPYWDQSNYITKTYNLAESFHNSRLLHRLNPDLYINAEPAMRPPLMMLLPALLWRRIATPHQIAYAWLFQRTLFLLAGMWVLSRLAKDARWVPAALFAILGSSYFLHLDPSVYLMDLPFACLALLSVALVFLAMQRRGFWSYVAAAIGTLALFLVKPQGAAFMFPFLAILCLERVFHALKSWRTHSKKYFLTLIAQALVMIALLLAFMHLLHGSYGNAVKTQYAWGQEGYWNSALTWSLAGQVIGGLCPLWIVLTLFIAAILRLYKKSPVPFQPHAFEGLPRISLTFLLALAFWLSFNLFLTYAIDARIAWSFMPISVCAVLIALWYFQPHRHFLTAITSIAGILFLVALTTTLFGWPTQTVNIPFMLVGPPITQQHPVAESGERNLVREVDSIIRAGPPALPPSQSVQVTILMCQPYAEYSGMVLAARWENHDEWSPTHYEQFPFGDTGFDLPAEFDTARVSWFLTRKGSSPDAVSPRALVTMRAMEALITDPKSPIHDAFEPRGAFPLTTPADTSTALSTQGITAFENPNAAILWHLKRPVTLPEFEKSLTFIQPFYKGAVGEPFMSKELEDFHRKVLLGTDVNIVPSSALSPSSESLANDIVFPNGLLLKRLRILPADKSPDHKAHIDMYWLAQQKIDLIGNRFFHLNDATGKIVGQADAPQDRLHGTIQPGTYWLDTVTLTSRQLQHATTIGIGIQYPNGKLAPIQPQPGTQLDWENQRLIVPLP